MNDKEQIKIMDENGKQFVFDLNDIVCFNADLADNHNTCINYDSSKKIPEISFVDEAGNSIDTLQLIQDMQTDQSDVVALDIQMEATHSGSNLNFTIYHEDSMEKDALTFLNPFQKPILKNHNSYNGEPLGRVTASWTGPSELTEERSAIHLIARVTDETSFVKFLDGRYKTVSIGGSIGVATCSICGKTIFKDNKFKFCGHWRGETYKDAVCYWSAKDITYHEVSVVNNPADVFAQIVKVTVIKRKSEEQNNKGGSKMGNNNDSTSKDETEMQQKFATMIDKLLENYTKTTTDSNESSSSTTQNSVDQNSDLTDNIKQEIDSLKQENATLKNEVESVKVNLELAKQERDNYKEMALTLAANDKEYRIEKIIAKEEKAGTIKDETAKKDRVSQLQGMSVKDLNSLNLLLDATLASKTSTRQSSQVTNPTFANNKDTSEQKQKDSGSQGTTVIDYSDAIIDKIFKNH